jgi:hypothetical protein
MKTKFILFFLLFACTAQAQTITHLEVKYYSYKCKLHDVQLWPDWIYSYDDTVSIEWHKINNIIEVKDPQDFTFYLYQVCPKEKKKEHGQEFTRFYLAGKDWDELYMGVTIDSLGNQDYIVQVNRRHLIVKYWCKEVSKPYKN